MAHYADGTPTKGSPGDSSQLASPDLPSWRSPRRKPPATGSAKGSGYRSRVFFDDHEADDATADEYMYDTGGKAMVLGPGGGRGAATRAASPTSPSRLEHWERRWALLVCAALERAASSSSHAYDDASGAGAVPVATPGGDAARTGTSSSPHKSSRAGSPDGRTSPSPSLRAQGTPSPTATKDGRSSPEDGKSSPTSAAPPAGGSGGGVRSSGGGVRSRVACDGPRAEPLLSPGSQPSASPASNSAASVRRTPTAEEEGAAALAAHRAALRGQDAAEARDFRFPRANAELASASTVDADAENVETIRLDKPSSRQSPEQTMVSQQVFRTLSGHFEVAKGETARDSARDATPQLPTLPSVQMTRGATESRSRALQFASRMGGLGPPRVRVAPVTASFKALASAVDQAQAQQQAASQQPSPTEVEPPEPTVRAVSPDPTPPPAATASSAPSPPVATKIAAKAKPPTAASQRAAADRLSMGKSSRKLSTEATPSSRPTAARRGAGQRELSEGGSAAEPTTDAAAVAVHAAEATASRTASEASEADDLRPTEARPSLEHSETIKAVALIGTPSDVAQQAATSSPPRSVASPPASRSVASPPASRSPPATKSVAASPSSRKPALSPPPPPGGFDDADGAEIAPPPPPGGFDDADGAEDIDALLDELFAPPPPSPARPSPAAASRGVAPRPEPAPSDEATMLASSPGKAYADAMAVAMRGSSYSSGVDDSAGCASSSPTHTAVDDVDEVELATTAVPPRQQAAAQRRSGAVAADAWTSGADVPPLAHADAMAVAMAGSTCSSGVDDGVPACSSARRLRREVSEARLRTVGAPGLAPPGNEAAIRALAPVAASPRGLAGSRSLAAMPARPQSAAPGLGAPQPRISPRDRLARAEISPRFVGQGADVSLARTQLQHPPPPAAADGRMRDRRPGTASAAAGRAPPPAGASLPDVDAACGRDAWAGRSTQSGAQLAIQPVNSSKQEIIDLGRPPRR